MKLRSANKRTAQASWRLRTTLAALSLVAVTSMAVAQTAPKDWLSGTYTAAPGGSKEGTPPELRVRPVANAAGWFLQSGDESVALEPMSEREQQDLLKNVNPSHQMQCGLSTFIIFCHVQAGTDFPAESFTSQTGYFIVVIDRGLTELVRLPP